MVKHLLTLAAAILLFAACQKEEEGIDSFPIFSTNPVNFIDSTGIEASLTITNRGNSKIDEAGFCIDTLSINTFTSNKSVPTDIIGGEGSINKRVNRIFLLGKKYYVRSYIKVKDAVIFGNEISFTGKREIYPIVKEFIAPDELHAIDTIYVKGGYFNYFKNKLQIYRISNDGYSSEPMNYTYVDSTTLKVYGSFTDIAALKIYYDFKNYKSITHKVNFKLYELSNIKLDKTTCIPEEIVTLSWEKNITNRDKWSLLINNIEPQIVEKSNNYIKIKLPYSADGWTIDLNFNNQKFSNNIVRIPPFESITAGTLKSGDKVIIKTKYPIDNYYEYFIAVSSTNNDYYLKYIDNRTLEFTVPDEKTMDDLPVNSDGTVSFTLERHYTGYRSYYYSEYENFGKLTFKYESSIGTRLGVLDIWNFEPNIISMVIDGDYCNYALNYNVSTIQIDNLSSPTSNSLNFPSYTNGSGIARNPNTGGYYFVGNNNADPMPLYETDDKYHYTGTTNFNTVTPIHQYFSSFYYNNKIYFLGYVNYNYFSDYLIYRDVYSLDLTSKEYKKEDINLPWKDEGKYLIYDYRTNIELKYVRTHNINGDIFIELLSLGPKSIYKLNKSTMQFEYFGDFPYNPNNSKMYSYEFNNKWCVLVDDRVWTFDGSNWTEWAKTPTNCALYFENNGKRYFKLKNYRNLYMLPM